MSPPSPASNSNKQNLWNTFLVCAAVVCALWGACWFVTWRMFGGALTGGEFGDWFGSVNALFSGLALAGVGCALVFQARELQGQERAQMETKAMLKYQANALLLSARIQALVHLKQQADEGSKGVSVLGSGKRSPAMEEALQKMLAKQKYFAEKKRLYTRRLKELYCAAERASGDATFADSLDDVEPEEGAPFFVGQEEGSAGPFGPQE